MSKRLIVDWELTSLSHLFDPPKGIAGQYVRKHMGPGDAGYELDENGEIVEALAPEELRKSRPGEHDEESSPS